MNPLLMVWNLQEVAVKHAYFYNEILMVLEASGGCCESIIDGLECPRGCCEAICTFANKYSLFGKLQKAAVNPLFVVWNLEDVAVKPFAHFYNEILMVLESPGGCCEAIMVGLGSPGSCCEAICRLVPMKY